MQLIRKSVGAVTLGLVVLATAAWLNPLTPAQGQDKSKSTRKSGKGTKPRTSANTKNLDIKADQLQSAFTRDAEELAGQYADAGHLDKARSILESALAVNPNSASLQKKLESVKEGQMTANDVEFDVNPARGWERSGVVVTENRPLRIRAEGTYKFDTGPLSLTAAGFPQNDPSLDFVPGILGGTLMGMIMGETKVGRPFPIGESLDFTPKESGMLMLRINAPAANKNTGKLRVTISGQVQTQQSQQSQQQVEESQ